MKIKSLVKEYSTLQAMNTDICTMCSTGWLVGQQYDIIPDNGLVSYIVEFWR